MNHASDLLKTILPPDGNHRDWVIIIDEFDQLKNEETIDFFTSLAKQITVDDVPAKFVFCGVASNLNDLIVSHESVDRYVKAIDLQPLLDGHILKIARTIMENLFLEMSVGQYTRIAQIASGYPHFAHLITDQIIRVVYDTDRDAEVVSPDVYKLGVQGAARGAAPRLQQAYERATRKGSDKYVEVLWAVADGQLLNKQFKDIQRDYLRLMEDRPNRESLKNEEQLRTYLNRLCTPSHGSVLKKSSVGWYEFADPMLRSYVRMVAHTEELDLGDESFRL